MATAKDKKVDETVAKIKKTLQEDAPGIFQSAIGGVEVEINGERVLKGYELVGVPTNELGLPESIEVLYKGWKSYKNQNVVLKAGQSSTPAGTWMMPMVVNGKIKMLQGKLMVLKGQGNPVPKWTFNVGIRNTYAQQVKDEAGDPTGEVKEGTNWVQPILVEPGLNYEMDRAIQRTAYDAMGLAIAISNNITFTVE